MDPESTLRVLQDTAEDTDTRIAAAENLIGWCNRGGFGPRGWSRANTIAFCARMLADLRPFKMAY